MVTIKSKKPVKTETVVCSCGSELEYSSKDIEVYDRRDYVSDPVYYYIICPSETCRERIFVERF